MVFPLGGRINIVFIISIVSLRSRPVRLGKQVPSFAASGSGGVECHRNT